ncbi:MAG: TolB family protein [Acidobacteriota bacterium]
MLRPLFAILIAAALGGFSVPVHAQTLGLFEGQTDVGSVTPPGSASYDSASQNYTLTAAGANLWGTADAFHFLWKKVSGDVTLTADLSFPETAGEHSPHRKAILIVRQSLDASSPYADAALHGAGLTALQFRRETGAITEDIELTTTSAPRRLRIEKRGDTFTMYVASEPGGPLHPVGASVQLPLQGPFYVGLGVCSHDPGRTEKAVFSHVTLEKTAPLPATLALYSTLNTIGDDKDFRRDEVVWSSQAHFEAPVWTRDGKTLVFDQDGKIMTVPATGGTPRALDTGEATRCTGSHGVSPDGTRLAMTCATTGSKEFRVYIVPIGGGTPHVLTEHPNSWFHSWSPDGKTILFSRPDHGSLNIFAIPASGGEEHALTTGTGISDDPDFSPDGQFIYFNSDRGGSMQIWRMHADGSSPEQLTHDDWVNWTAHPSPDGQSIVFLSYAPGTTGHPANQPIALRLMSLRDRSIHVLTRLIGGGGTMNVPNWSPDGKRLAFVSYQMLPAEPASNPQ